MPLLTPCIAGFSVVVENCHKVASSGDAVIQILQAVTWAILVIEFCTLRVPFIIMWCLQA